MLILGATIFLCAISDCFHDKSHLNQVLLNFIRIDYLRDAPKDSQQQFSSGSFIAFFMYNLSDCTMISYPRVMDFDTVTFGGAVSNLDISLMDEVPL